MTESETFVMLLIYTVIYSWVFSKQF